MNAISKALDEIKYRIPKEILNIVFSNIQVGWRNTAISLDEQILSKVIKSRVLIDCNLVGGTEAFISLEGVEQYSPDQFVTVFRIPKDMTQGRTIMSVSSVSYVSPGMMAIAPAIQGYNQSSVKPSLVAGQAMMDAMSPIPVTSTARVELIAENTIMVRDIAPRTGHGYLRCTLANDDQLSHIQMASILQFCTLCEHAVKSYIYNETIIALDKGQLYGGHEIGKFRDIIESYSEEEKEYQDYLRNTWMAVAFMNDAETFTRFIKMGMGTFR